MTEVLMSFYARLYGRRSARNRAVRALNCAKHDVDGPMSHRGWRLRPIAEPFVIAAPEGARARTRLVTDDADRVVLEALGAHLGALASADLARRVAEGNLDAKVEAESRAKRKRELTAGSSSRWAGAITRTTESSYGLAKRNLQAERDSLRARIN
jgi:hypothetical protein